MLHEAIALADEAAYAGRIQRLHPFFGRAAQVFDLAERIARFRHNNPQASARETLAFYAQINPEVDSRWYDDDEWCDGCAECEPDGIAHFVGEPISDEQRRHARISAAARRLWCDVCRAPHSNTEGA